MRGQGMADRMKLAKRTRPEQQLHMAVASYLRLALRPPTIWTTIGHGGGGKVRGALLKAMGVQPGWPDILVLGPTTGEPFALIGIELKAAKGMQSPEQKKLGYAFVAAGGFYYLARSVDEVEGFLRGVGIPLHASVSAKAVV